MTWKIKRGSTSRCRKGGMSFLPCRSHSGRGCGDSGEKSRSWSGSGVWLQAHSMGKWSFSGVSQRDKIQVLEGWAKE